MTDPSSALNAAVCAVRGESDLATVRPALTDERLVRVTACAPGAHAVMQTIAALRCGLTGLADPAMGASPAFREAFARLIGTAEGQTALRAWAEVAPAGWGL